MLGFTKILPYPLSAAPFRSLEPWPGCGKQSNDGKATFTVLVEKDGEQPLYNRDTKFVCHSQYVYIDI